MPFRHWFEETGRIFPLKGVIRLSCILKHTYAAEFYTSLLNSGAKENEAKLTVSRLLGHEREDVTNIYLAGIGKVGE